MGFVRDCEREREREKLQNELKLRLERDMMTCCSEIFLFIDNERHKI